MWTEEVADFADGAPQGVDGADRLGAQERFELGESHLDRIEVGTVGRQKEEPGAFGANGLLGRRAFVGRQIVADDDVAWLEGRGQLRLDIGFEDAPIHRRVDHERRGERVAAQAGDEGLGLPMSERRLGEKPSPLGTAAAQTRHLGGGSSLVQEDEPVRLKAHPRLADFCPFLARVLDVGAILFARPQSFF